MAYSICCLPLQCFINSTSGRRSLNRLLYILFLSQGISLAIRTTEVPKICFAIIISIFSNPNFLWRYSAGIVWIKSTPAFDLAMELPSKPMAIRKKKKHDAVCWTRILKILLATKRNQARDFWDLYNTQFAKTWWQKLLFKGGESPAPTS